MTQVKRASRTFKILLQRLAPTAIIYTLMILLAALGYGLIEGADPLRSLYWATVTGFTVGFGDVLPSGAPGMLLCIVFIPASAITYLVLAAHIVGVVFDNRNEFTHEDEAKMFSDLAELRAEMQAVINHLGIQDKVTYSEEGCK
jgi:hypothetical protein